MMYKLFISAIIFLFIGNNLDAQLTQWRGENRDGLFGDTLLLDSWGVNGPELLLEFEGIGKGYSSVIYNKGVYYATGMIDTLDYLSAISENGELLWQVSYGRSWIKSFPDTRSTPTKEDNRIYVQSGTGRVACIDAIDGKEIWAMDVDKEFEAEYHIWGNSETPLIVDDKVICNPAGKKTAVVALNKLTGELIWQSEPTGFEKTARGYASATIFEWNNFRYILALNSTHILAIDPETGEIVCQYQYFKEDEWWNQPGLIWANTPLIKDNEIFLSMGYDYKAVMIQMDSTGTSFSEKFVDHTLDNHHHGLVYFDEHIYGSNWRDNRRGKWVCMKWDTGEIKYVDDWGSKGTIVLADQRLYCYNEKGQVGLVKPNPESFEVLSEFKITKGSGPHWAHPFIAEGKLILRHGDVLMVYKIKK